MVKNNLFSMMAHEKQSYHSNNSSQDQYESVNRKIDDMVHETEAFKVLNQKYENLRMAFEDISEQLSNKIEEMNRKVGERNEVIRQVKYEN